MGDENSILQMSNTLATRHNCNCVHYVSIKQNIEREERAARTQGRIKAWCCFSLVQGKILGEVQYEMATPFLTLIIIKK